MKALKWLAIALGAYVGLVAAFECLVGFFGNRQAQSGALSDERWIIITTLSGSGPKDTVIAGVEHDGHLYVAANHWPRGWYHRAIETPNVAVTRAGSSEKKEYRAVPLEGADRAAIEQVYVLPFAIRFLTGFPPREFLRLDPR